MNTNLPGPFHLRTALLRIPFMTPLCASRCHAYSEGNMLSHAYPEQSTQQRRRELGSSELGHGLNSLRREL
jgi:hypothetical protein